MSYVVFARKWRPQNFDEVLGQEHVAKTLKNALSLKRIAHAYIFCGPRGVGKTSTARILAKALNCQKQLSSNPCNKCSTCKEITQGSNLDVLEIDGASNRGIDEIRQLRENIKFTPSAARFKIYIIDEVHMLTTEAFNALLKTLEEPPGHVKFIFATTQPHRVVSTILSRCQRFDFRKIPILKIIQKLKEIISTEHIRIDEKVLMSIAKAADGSLRDAESILDQLISYSKDTISLKDVSSVLGLVEQDVLFEFSKLIIQGESGSVLKLLDTLVASGKDLGKLLDNLIEHFRNLMIARISDSEKLAGLVDLPAEFAEAISGQSKKLDLSKIIDILQVLIEVKDLGKRINSLRIPLEISLVKITYQIPEASPKIKLNNEVPDTKFSQNESVIKSIPAVIKNERGSFSISTKKEDKEEDNKGEIQPPQLKPETSSEISLEMVHSVWANFIDGISKQKMSVATYLAEARPEICENNVITVSLPKASDFHKEFLECKGNHKLIEDMLAKVLEVKIRVNFIIGDRQSKEKAGEDDFIKDVLHKFKGRLLR